MSLEQRFERLTAAPTDSLRTASVRGGIFTMGAEGINLVLRLFSIFILARLLPPEYFGLIGMVTAITMIAERFRDLGLASAVVQRAEINHRQVSTLFWLNAGVGVAIMLVVAALAYPLSLFFDDARILPITLALATTFAFSGMAIQHGALLRRQMKFSQIAAINIFANVASILLAIVMASNGFGYWSLVGREISRDVLIATGSWFCFPWIPSAPSRNSGAGAMLRFGGNVTAFNAVWFLSSSVDQILIGKLFGAASLGFYRQATNLVFAPVHQLVYPIQLVSESTLSRLQNAPDAYRRFYRKILEYLSMTSMPMMAFLVVYAEEVVLLALGPQWGEAVPIFRVLAIASFLRPASSTSGAVMLTCGYSRRLFLIGTVAGIFLVLFIVAGIPWGPVGIASAHVWGVWLLLVPKLIWTFKGTPINTSFFMKAIARPVAGSMVMALVLYALKSATPEWSDVTAVVIGLIVAVFVFPLAYLIDSSGRRIFFGLFEDLAEAVGLSRFVPWGSRRSPDHSAPSEQS